MKKEDIISLKMAESITGLTRQMLRYYIIRNEAPQPINDFHPKLYDRRQWLLWKQPPNRMNQGRPKKT